MLSPEKLAAPATAATVFLPHTLHVVVSVSIASVMFPVNPVAVLPLPSWAVTSTAGVIAAPATVVVGWTLKTSAEAVAAVMLNAALVVRSEERRVGVECGPRLSMLRPKNGRT